MDHEGARTERAPYIELYVNALRPKMAEYKLEESSLNLAAHELFDALVFAAAPSLTLVTRGVVGAYLNDLTEGSDLSIVQSELGATIMEAVRWAPPVLAAPFEEHGTRFHATVGYTGYDETRWGDDARDFRVRGDIDYYRLRTLNWSDKALPLAGQPNTARICPARSLSFNLVLAFLDAMGIYGWEVADGADPPRFP